MSKKISSQISDFNQQLYEEVRAAKDQLAREVAEFSAMTANQMYGIPLDEYVPLSRRPTGFDATQLNKELLASLERTNDIEGIKKHFFSKSTGSCKINFAEFRIHDGLLYVKVEFYHVYTYSPKYFLASQTDFKRLDLSVNKLQQPISEAIFRISMY